MAKNCSDVTDHVTFTEKWYAFYNISSHCVIMCKHSITGVLFEPLYIHSMKLLQPYALLKTKKFYSVYNENSLPQNTSDKLKYYRYKRGLLQREVANFIGIDRKTYSAYESGLRNYYPLDKLSLLAKLFEADIKDLLNEYNTFLYNGQGGQIRQKRKSLQLTQYQFGKLFGVNSKTVMRWENENVTVSKSTWLKITEMQ